MKILCIIDSLGIGGGAQTQFAGLVRMLKEKSFQVCALSYFNEPAEKSLEPELLALGIECICIKDSNSKIDKLKAVYNQVKLYKPDLVIAYLDGPSVISCIIKILYPHFNLIVSERNVTQKLSLKERVKFYLYKFADLIVPNAYSQQLYIESNFSFLKNKVLTISNFVDTAKFFPKNFTYTRNKLEILTVSRIGEQKNVLGFLDALKILKDKGVSFHVDWFGFNYPKYYSLVLRKKSVLELDNYITFYDSRKDIDTIYHKEKYDVFCLPSFFEGCPNTVAEAMSSGYPILCSNVCDNPRYVIDSKNGFLFDPNSPSDIAEKIVQFINLSEANKVEMGQLSRDFAKSYLSQSAFINKYTDAIFTLKNIR